MLGAIIGDIAGSVYEFDNIKTKDFPFFRRDGFPTDDSVLTVAVANWLLDGGDLAAHLRRWGRAYSDRGYGARFAQWMFADDAPAYQSWGNGSAMRVSPCAWAGRDAEQVVQLARASALPTHDHPLGIKGAEAAAIAQWLAQEGAEGDAIRTAVEQRFGYDLSASPDDIRPTFEFDESCEGTVPVAIICATRARDFEDAIRTAVSLGGDCDTVAAITGGIAEARFGIPPALVTKARSYLPDEMNSIVDRFYERFVGRPPGGKPAPAL